MQTGVAATARSNALFTSLVSGAYASAATALLFLVIDGARGQPLYTPSLLGSVVLLGQDPASVSGLRLDMGALYSLVHLAVFIAIGALATSSYNAWEALRSPLVLGAALMGALSLGVLLADTLLFPGLVTAIGPVALGAGNLVAAATMTWFVVRSG